MNAAWCPLLVVLTSELLCREMIICLLELFLCGNARNVLQHGQNVRIEAVEVGPWDAGTVNPAKIV